MNHHRLFNSGSSCSSSTLLGESYAIFLNLTYLGTESFHPARCFRILTFQPLWNDLAHLVPEPSRHPVT